MWCCRQVQGKFNIIAMVGDGIETCQNDFLLDAHPNWLFSSSVPVPFRLLYLPNGWYYIRYLKAIGHDLKADSLLWAWLVVSTKPSAHNLIKMLNNLIMSSLPHIIILVVIY